MAAHSSAGTTIKAIDKNSIHKITSGQVVIDLQTAVKELVENCIDAGSTSIEVRFKDYGLSSIEVIDNGCGVAEQDHESIGLKHHTSKISSFTDLTTVRTFGFRGEALASLCALCESVSVSTTTQSPMGTLLQLESSGKVGKRTKVARQRGTTVTLTKLFAPLPVRRKELERNAKREFGKALSLLNAYALGPCSAGIQDATGTQRGVRLTVSNQAEKGQKSVQIRTQGTISNRTTVTDLWGPKALENITDLAVSFTVEPDKASLKRLGAGQAVDADPIIVQVKGLVSKFSTGCGRTGTDRQFFYVNGRPCNLTKVQKGFNESYRSFNANQSPFVIADFILPTEACDVNLSPDKRTIFLHSEGNLISALKDALEAVFASARSTYDIGATQSKNLTQSVLPASLPPRDPLTKRTSSRREEPAPQEEDSEDEITELPSSLPLPQYDEPQSQPPARSQTPTQDKEPLFLGSPEPSRAPAPINRPPLPASDPNEDRMDVDSIPPRALPATPSRNPPISSPSATKAAAPTNAVRQATLTTMFTKSAPALKKSSVTLDTTKASWSPQRRRHLTDDELATRASQDEEVEDEGLGDAPHRKRRRSKSPEKRADQDGESIPQAPTLTVKPKSKASSALTSKTSRSGLRTALAQFARKGSQIPQVRDEDEDMEDAPAPIPRPEHSAASADDDDDDDDLNEMSSTLVGQTGTSSSGTLLCAETNVTLNLNQEAVTRPEVLRRADGHDIIMGINVSEVADRWKRRERSRFNGSSSSPDETDPMTDSNNEHRPKLSLDAGVQNVDDTDSAADALSRIIEKEDFGKMEVIGQFNLGFIIARRRKAVATGPTVENMDDLFIVDQHAADEKYNFETLQQTTKIKSQPLLKPRCLELTAADELTAVDNIDILRQNGFEVEVETLQSGEADDEQMECEDLQGKLKLLALPVSKSTTFDMKDLEELIHLMRDRPSGQMVRCSKARAMFAMRACRKSVMVGMPLTKQQMLTLVGHMGTMDQPWNCPHGRPTMRHLYDLNSHMRLGQLEGKESAVSRLLDWESFQ
ncbi:DNA mismatch repair protein MutL [Pluteus cervinus]|uniref:DNA mismatch repair protein MutL n=1 Tax=Pluteus cervinus TaxID=181527 RepID=A0ACD3B357_9AGAR|nr:DNA mismatch repair protein MutL [Pluteus cervinus]